MKKCIKNSPLQMVFALLLSMVVAFAMAVPGAAADYPLINDEAGLLTESGKIALQAKAEEYSAKWQQDIAIYTTNDLGGLTDMEAADDYFDYNGFGQGDDYSGIVMLVYDNGYGYWISTCGQTIDAVTDYGIEYILDEVFYELQDEDDYDAAFDAYLDAVDELLSINASGKPYDIGNTSGVSGNSKSNQLIDGDVAGVLSMAWMMAFGGALIFCLIFVFQLRSKHSKHSASDYIIGQGLNLTRREDLYLYSSTSKVRRQEDSGSRGGGSRGGSSTHRSSSGRSHGGGGRRR